MLSTTAITLAFICALSHGVQADILAGAPDTAPDGYSEWISPIIYPSPPTTGQGIWAEAVAKARAFVSDLTLEEKVNITTGVGLTGRCVGNTGTIPRKQFAGFCLEDGPAGVRLTDYNSVFPVGINTAALWDKKLIYERSAAMGVEFRGKGVNIALTPGMNMARAPAAGRNFEYAGGDPYLAGVVAKYSIQGVQDQGVIANAKHFIGNEQEHARGSSLAQAYSMNADDRTLHEVYLWPFAESVEAGVASVMCSYNRINQTYGCENSYMMNGILKGELGFQGFVTTDWAAQTRGIDSALAGVDVDMPGFKLYQGGDFRSPVNESTGFPGEPNPSVARGGWFGANLIDAVNNGTMPESRLTDMVTRIMAAYFKLGQDKGYPAVNFDSRTRADVLDAEGPQVNFHVDVQHNHKKLIREIGAASAVLLKNENDALPLNLDDIRSIGVFGEAAGPSPNGANGCVDRGCFEGTLAIGWGSGTANFPYLIDPYSAILSYATSGDYHTTVEGVLNDTNPDQTEQVAARSQICLVFVGADSGEAYITVEGNMGDRNDLLLWHNGTELVQQVAQNCSNTIVGLQIPSAIDMEAFADHPNVTAIVNFGMAGQEAGNAVVDILFGAVNPSGRLPYTIGKRREDYAADVEYFNTTDLTPSSPISTIPQLDYVEKLNIDYRHFEANGIEPRYAFGHGLSYSTFNYQNLNIVRSSSSGKGHDKRELEGFLAGQLSAREVVDADCGDDTDATKSALYAFNNYQNSSSPALQSGNSTRIVQSIPPRRIKQQPGNLYDEYMEVSFSVYNEGRAGHEVAQLYLSFPESAGEPPKVLRGFERMWMDKGGAAQFHLILRRKDVSVWDTPSQSWYIPEGTFTVHIGASSADIRLTSTFQV